MISWSDSVYWNDVFSSSRFWYEDEAYYKLFSFSLPTMNVRECTRAWIRIAMHRMQRSVIGRKQISPVNSHRVSRLVSISESTGNAIDISTHRKGTGCNCAYTKVLLDASCGGSFSNCGILKLLFSKVIGRWSLLSSFFIKSCFRVIPNASLFMMALKTREGYVNADTEKARKTNNGGA